MFLVVLHQAATEAKINRHSIRLQNLSMNNVPLSTNLSNNHTINAWIEAADIGELTDKTNDLKIDYEELGRRITSQREKQLLKRRKQAKTK